MNVNFHYNSPEPSDPIVFEEIFGEKPGGGLISNPSYDIPQGVAVGKNASGLYAPIKGYIVAEDAEASATSIKIKKGSGIAVGDVLSNGEVAVACTEVDTTSSDEYDTVTVNLNVAVSAGDILGQAKAATTTASEIAPVYDPEYLVGNFVPAGEGDFPVRLVNGANVRKETAPVADFVVKLMKNIAKV